MPIFRPGKPWGARGLSVNTLSAGGGALVPFDTFAGDGDIIGITGGLEVQRDGLYQVTFGVGRASQSPSPGVMQATVRRNAAAWILAHSINGTGSAGVSGGRLAELVSGDELTIITSNGGTLRATDTFLCAVRVGPVRWT